jgi:hypothetical protein
MRKRDRSHLRARSRAWFARSEQRAWIEHGHCYINYRIDLPIFVTHITAMAKKRSAPVNKRTKKKTARSLDLDAKRAEQVAQGALDGRFRVKVVKNKKRYVRKPIQKDDLEL